LVLAATPRGWAYPKIKIIITATVAAYDVLLLLPFEGLSLRWLHRLTTIGKRDEDRNFHFSVARPFASLPTNLVHFLRYTRRPIGPTATKFSLFHGHTSALLIDWQKMKSAQKRTRPTVSSVR
jgi:hypothetical protein